MQLPEQGEEKGTYEQQEKKIWDAEMRYQSFSDLNVFREPPLI